MQPRTALVVLSLACLAAAGAGCFSTKNQVVPLTRGQAQMYLRKAKDPRMFSITVYRSANGPVFEGANRLHANQVAMLHFRHQATARKFITPAQEQTYPATTFDVVEKDEYLTLFDTSSQQSWVDFPTAQKIRVTPLGPPVFEYAPLHVAGEPTGFLGVAPKLRFDESLRIENPLLCVRLARGPMGRLARRDFKPWPVCVVGCNLMKSFGFVQFDYPAKMLVLSASGEYSPNLDLLVAQMPLEDADGVFAVEGVIDGTPSRVVLDSAGDFDVVMARAPAEPLRQLSLGNLVFRQVAATEIGEEARRLLPHPRIGRRLLSRYKVTIAPKKKMVYFEKPPPKSLFGGLVPTETVRP